MTPIEHQVALWEMAPSMYTHTVTLAYDPADPYAITLRFPSPSGRTSGISYTFGRELLVDAVELGHPAGDDGQVRLTPYDDGWIGLELHPRLVFESTADAPPAPDPRTLAQPDGYHLLLDGAPAQGFLNATYEAVPLGAETYLVEAELTRLARSLA